MEKDISCLPSTHKILGLIPALKKEKINASYMLALQHLGG
jgi:hypothetical protein